MARPMLSRRWLLTGVAAGVLAVVLLWPAPRQPLPAEAAPRAKTPVAAGGAPTIASAVAAYRERPAAIRAAEPATREPGPGEAEICGLGIVRLGDDGSSGSDPLAPLQRDAAVLATRALASKADPRLRAAGLYYESRIAMRAADAEAASPAANRLAAWAVNSSDPMVYALALLACRPGGLQVAGACGQLSIAQWARLDPANGVPWLFLAEEARGRGDRAAEAEAYYRASSATGFGSGWGVLPSLIDEGLAGTLPEPARGLAELDAWLLQGSFGTPDYAGLVRFCSAEAAADANRRQVCEGIAALQMRRGSFLDALIGVRIAERSGWPSARASEARAQLGLLRENDTPVFGEPASALDCPSVQRRRERARLDRELGEVGAARQRAGSAARR